MLVLYTLHFVLYMPRRACAKEEQAHGLDDARLVPTHHEAVRSGVVLAADECTVLVARVVHDWRVAGLAGDCRCRSRWRRGTCHAILLAPFAVPALAPGAVEMPLRRTPPKWRPPLGEDGQQFLTDADSRADPRGGSFGGSPHVALIVPVDLAEQ